MDDRTRGACKYCGTIHPEGEIANPHYCIARLDEMLEKKDRLIRWWMALCERQNTEIERLQTNIDVMKRAFRLGDPTAPTPKEDGDG